MSGASRADRTLPLVLLGVAAIVALVLSTAALTASLVAGPMGGLGSWMRSGGPMGGGNGGMMGGGWRGGGMMGGGYGGMMGGAVRDAGPQPGDPDFVAGSETTPRVIPVIAGPGPRFAPSVIRVASGETITFVVTTMGPDVHEFMVGPADRIATHDDDLPEIDDIGMMETKRLTTTFAGSGPYAFACHVDDHYELGMRGVIELVD